MLSPSVPYSYRAWFQRKYRVVIFVMVGICSVVIGGALFVKCQPAHDDPGEHAQHARWQ